MTDGITPPPKIMIDLERLNTLNAEGCAACGRKFSLGEMAVSACGSWEGGARIIHAAEAVYDRHRGCYFERKHYAGLRP